MIADDVRAAFERPGNLLQPALSATLAEVGWRRLSPARVTRGTYSTARAREGDPTLRRAVATRLPVPGSEALLQIETFTGGVPDRYSDLGIIATRVRIGRLVEALGTALRTLAIAPAAIGTVAQLARSLHPIAVDDPETDVSYSDPEVPFSIFIGVHDEEVPDEPLRLAEAILHETMHLQLSLIEDVVPLASGATERLHSPWQGRPRPAQGVLHGLYVFRAVQEFLLMVRPDLGGSERTAYVDRRLVTIQDEITAASAVVECVDLTDAGRDLAARLIRPSPV